LPGFHGSHAVFLAEITDRSTKNFQRQLRMNAANGFLGALVAKNPAQSPVVVAALFVLQRAYIRQLFYQRGQRFQRIFPKIFSNLQKHIVRGPIAGATGCSNPIILHYFQGSVWYLTT
jgi:hypothetical protein